MGIYDLPLPEEKNPRAFADIATVAICFSSALRIDDVEFLSKQYTFLPADAEDPRMHKWIQIKAKETRKVKIFKFKNRISNIKIFVGINLGTGPEAMRTTVVPCHCVALIDDAIERRNFYALYKQTY